MIDRGEEVLWQRESCANARGMLNATRVKSVFARLVRDAIENLGYSRQVKERFGIIKMIEIEANIN